MKTSPFPGLDPYLEASWSDVHTQLTALATAQLNPNLPDSLVARSETYVTIDIEDQDRLQRFSPDVSVRELAEGEWETESEDLAVAVAEPVLVPTSEPWTQRRIQILTVEDQPRLVTVIEFLSPANKIGVEERAQYRTRRRHLVSAGVNYVEIDLIRAGSYVLFPDVTFMTGRLDTPYRVCVISRRDPTTAQVYPILLREKLPAFRIPLRPGDRAVALELQPLFDQVYQNGKYGRTINYHKNPEPPLIGDDAVWAENLLKQAGLR